MNRLPVARALAVVLAVIALGMAGTADAIQVNDTNLSMPFYPGSGNSNLHFAVDTSGPVEVGLKAKLRYGGDVTPDGNVYTVPTGVSTVGGVNYAAWNYDFSVSTGAGYNGYLISFAYDINPGAGQTWIGGTYPASGVGPLWQDSWNYGMFPSNIGFNPNQAGDYDIILRVSDLAGNTVASSSILVSVASPVPIPGALLLFGSGLLGLVGISRKRLKK